MPFLPVLLPVLAAAAGTAQELPARFDADRVYLIAPVAKNGTLTLYTDTGGGLFVTEPAVKRLGIPTRAAPKGGDMPPDTQVMSWPTFRGKAAVPKPPSGYLPVMPAAMVAKEGFDSDGMLGEAWFGGRVWTWDYPNHRFLLQAKGWKPAADATRVKLGFPVDKSGARETNFPRITVKIDGKPIDLLLDTGATTKLTTAAVNAIGDGQPAARATSMIVDTQFQAWRKAHPDWRVIENAQDRSHAAMIEVPSVEIAGHAIGPVWFTWRPDTNFHDYMSSMMDAKVEGALGGNALRHFEMTIDYPGAVAWFRCTKDCAATPPPAP